MRNQEEKMELQKVHRRVCVRDITFVAARPLSYLTPSFLSHFLSLFSSTPNLRRKKILLQKMVGGAYKNLCGYRYLSNNMLGVTAIQQPASNLFYSVLKF